MNVENNKSQPDKKLTREEAIFHLVQGHFISHTDFDKYYSGIEYVYFCPTSLKFRCKNVKYDFGQANDLLNFPDGYEIYTIFKSESSEKIKKELNSMVIEVDHLINKLIKVKSIISGVKS